MELTTPQSPEFQSNSDIYRTFVKSFGVESPLANTYLLAQESIVAEDVVDEHLNLDDLWKQQVELNKQNINGEITNDQLCASLAVLQARYNQTRIFNEATKVIDDYPTHASIETLTDNDIVTQINVLLQQTRSLIDGDTKKPAPFSDYAKNTSTSWKHVDNQTITDRLKTKPFISLKDLIVLSDNSRSVTYLNNYSSRSNKLFEVPTRLMVNAAGFKSWLGRSDNYGLEGLGEKAISLPQFWDGPTSVSINAIKAYAGHPQELPYVSKVEVFIQPNGLAFAGNGSGDSHRISAAILRGQETIKAKNMVIRLLKDNCLSR